MAITLGGSRARAEINVTPLIDVLLVLLIIFMVITPTQSVGLDALVPQPSPEQQRTTLPDRTIVIQIGKDLDVSINAEPTDMQRLGPRLVEIFAVNFSTRAERAVFVKAHADTEFQHVARAIDIAKGAGIPNVGLLSKTAY